MSFPPKEDNKSQALDAKAGLKRLATGMRGSPSPRNFMKHPAGFTGSAFITQKEPIASPKRDKSSKVPLINS